VRSYEFLEQDWWLPLCDHELMDFFRQVPARLRWDRTLYLGCLKERVFRGRLAALAELPVIGEGARFWQGRPRSPLAQWRRTCEQWRFRRVAARCELTPLRFYEWVIPAEELARTRTIGELMVGPGGPLAPLDGPVAQVVADFKDFPVCKIPPLGLLAAACLARARRSARG